jgi:hypothetical protein
VHCKAAHHCFEGSSPWGGEPRPAWPPHTPSLTARPIISFLPLGQPDSSGTAPRSLDEPVSSGTAGLPLDEPRAEAAKQHSTRKKRKEHDATGAAPRTSLSKGRNEQSSLSPSENRDTDSTSKKRKERDAKGAAPPTSHSKARNERSSATRSKEKRPTASKEPAWLEQGPPRKVGAERRESASTRPFTTAQLCEEQKREEIRKQWRQYAP